MDFITSKNGDKLIEFRAGKQPTVLSDYPDLAITFSCVIAKYQGRALFVYNPWRKEWELPAGNIKTDETPHDAGVRELAEETGQKVSALNYKGLCLLGLHPDNQLELGAIYQCELEQVEPFEANEETTKMMFWDQGVETEEYVNEIGIELVRLVDELS